MSLLQDQDDTLRVDYGYVELHSDFGTLSQGSDNASITVRAINDPHANLLTLRCHNGETAGMNLYLTKSEAETLVSECLEQLEGM